MRTLDTLIVTPTIAPAQGAILLTGDPIKWVDDWAIAGPSTNDRKKIKAQLLAAHATFWRTLSEAPHDCVAPMRQAFTGIAEILFMADLLTVEILNRELPLFVLEAAIAGHWWHMCSATDTRTEIFPGHFGHVDDWQEMNSRWYGLFAAEIAEWHSKLLEVEVPKPLPEQQIPREPAAPEGVGPDINGRKSERKKLRDDYKAECKQAGVRLTDEMIAMAANPRTSTKKGWTTRDPIQKWLQCDPKYDGEYDRLIRKLFRNKPHLPKPHPTKPQQ